MSKVKLTREQARELEYYKLDGEEQIDYLVNVHHNKLRPDLEISKLTTSEIAKALYIGYEIEEEFKSGDWIVNNQGRVLQVTEVYLEDGNEIVEANDGQVFTYRLGAEFVRHATPDEIAEEKERRWWAKHGREVWELRKGDVIKSNTTCHVVYRSQKDNNGDMYIEFYEHGSIFTIKELRDLKSKVVCFVESRKDE